MLRDKTEAEGGLLYDDPRLGLKWPLAMTVMSDKDRTWKLLEQQEAEIKQRMSPAPGA